MKTGSNQPARAAMLGVGLTLFVACSLTLPAEDELFRGGRGGRDGSVDAGAPSGGSGDQAPPGPSEGGSAEAGAGGAVGAAGEEARGGQPSNEPGTGGEAGAPGEVVLPPAVLFLHYTFDDVSELIAVDETGNERHGTLAGTSLPAGDVGKIDGALKLNGALKQYVQMPSDVLDGKPAVSIASWLKLGQAVPWDRLFDFNSGESNWFYFSPTGWNSSTMTFGTRIATRTPSALAPEIMLERTVSVDAWHHVAVVFAKPYLRYYLDGELQSELSNVPFDSAALGKTSQNWIGRSVYAADPYLTGWVDDFRLYAGALTADEVRALHER